MSVDFIALTLVNGYEATVSRHVAQPSSRESARDCEVYCTANKPLESSEELPCIEVIF